MSGVSNPADSTPSPVRAARTVFAVTGAIGALVAWAVNGFIVVMAGAEASQSSDADFGAKSLYLVGMLMAVVLAVCSAVLTRRRPRGASLLGAVAVLLGILATVAIAYGGVHGFSKLEAKVIVLAIWLFLTSPLDVAIVMGLLPMTAEADPKRGRIIALAYVGLSTVLLIVAVFPSQNATVALGALIVWLLLTSAITTLGVRGAVRARPE